MIRGEAYAKVNFGLRVGGRNRDGFHDVDGIFQSVAIADTIALAAHDEDQIVGRDGRPVIDGLDNLAFRAARAVRDSAGATQPLRIELDKSIPTAAGLGGGSADAAAALALAGRYFGVGAEVLADLAPQLGSDVPFCLVGGSARVSGRGDVVTPIDHLVGFSLVVVVPPVEISTAAAFAVWDELDGPRGLRMPQSALPPPLRAQEELRNDLYPAAVAIVPDLDDWRRDLEKSWGRPVMLSGSGPSLFGFFLDAEEAEGATTAAPRGARLVAGCELMPVGWRIEEV